MARDHGLNSVEARIVRKDSTLVASDQAVVAQQPELVRVLGRVGGDNAAVAPDVQILQRVKAVAGESAETANLAALVGRLHGVTGVGNDGDAVLVCDRLDAIHGAGFA